MEAIGHALMMSFTMAWEILRTLILGFSLSAVIQAVVSKEEVSRLLPETGHSLDWFRGSVWGPTDLVIEGRKAMRGESPGCC